MSNECRTRAYRHRRRAARPSARSERAPRHLRRVPRSSATRRWRWTGGCAPRSSCRCTNFRKAAPAAGAPLRAGGIGGARPARRRRVLAVPAAACAGRRSASSTSCTKPVVGERTRRCPPAALADVLATSRRAVRYVDARGLCLGLVRFTDGVVPHLVVQTTNGPMTVMLLAHEKVSDAPGVLRRRNITASCCRRARAASRC